VHVRPNHYSGNDAGSESSRRYRALWLKHASPSTPTDPGSEGRVLDATVSTEWWLQWGVEIDPSWDITKEGTGWWVQMNLHNTARDVGGDGGAGIGWGFGSGVSAIRFDCGRGKYRLLVEPANSGEWTIDESLDRGVEHTMRMHLTMGRKDGTGVGGNPGRVVVWQNGQQKVDTGPIDTLQRATNPRTGKTWTQQKMLVWNGYYTQDCQQDCLLRLRAEKAGRTLAAMQTDSGIRLVTAVASDIWNGQQPNLGPSSYKPT
jgi:hypothetical protein